jgi:hypothetical protein
MVCECHLPGFCCTVEQAGQHWVHTTTQRIKKTRQPGNATSRGLLVLNKITSVIEDGLVKVDDVRSHFVKTGICRRRCCIEFRSSFCDIRLRFRSIQEIDKDEANCRNDGCGVLLVALLLP